MVQEDGSGQVTLSALDPSLDATKFLRLDLEDLPWPSFHRPDLVNFWYHRLLMLLVDSGMDENEAVRAILQPYDANWAPTSPLTPQQAALITAIKRKISLRPMREDHPHFDGGNPLSVPGNFPTTLRRPIQLRPAAVQHCDPVLGSSWPLGRRQRQRRRAG